MPAFAFQWLARYTLLLCCKGFSVLLTPLMTVPGHSNIIADSGGPCGIDDYSGPDKSFGARFNDQGYLDCVR